ncbi:MAG: phosphoribosyltransferase family protein [Candidatus Kerfeldbacteria bacterium]
MRDDVIMSEETAIEIIRTAGALLTEGHFVLTSGMHSGVYVNKAMLATQPQFAHTLGAAMADAFAEQTFRIVVVPAIGAIPFGLYAAERRMLKTSLPTKLVYAEKVDGAFALRRGFDKLVGGNEALVVEDIMSTGGTAREIVGLVRAAGGTVVGVSAVWNRGKNVTAESLGVRRLVSLVNHQFPQWDPKAEPCPLCENGTPVNTEVGHGKEFLAQQGGSRA